jgi:hypothetical protein
VNPDASRALRAAAAAAASTAAFAAAATVILAVGLFARALWFSHVPVAETRASTVALCVLVSQAAVHPARSVWRRVHRGPVR